ncbi:4952_t:CDS:2 [Acaulospora colombiana]|uniref:4952_t:CDS:1 n=1 Tax=Acaulospora colombiana TaxID=27376 RepID=A0ACA9KWQ5_9GLOM|nr:4952_t:CDS:2 [Acaulospora colombiana]
MACVQEKLEEYERLDDEDQVLLRRALALSLERNEVDVEDSPQRALSLSLRGEINKRPEEVESIPRFMSFGTPILGAPSFTESPQSSFYHDLNDQYKQWIEQQQMFNERQADSKEPHEQTPFSPVSVEELANHGVLYWHFEGEDCMSKIDEIARERNYNSRDEVSSDNSDLYESKMKTFFEEHLHEDEEIRYITEGSGFFDVRGKMD